MNKVELLEIITNGENSGVEFKRDYQRPEQLAKAVVALANLDGGRVLLGVEDDGTISGIKRENLQNWVMDTVFGRYVHPTIIPYYEEVQIDEGQRVAVITVRSGLTKKPYVVRRGDREETYIRMGNISKLASREKLVELFAMGGMLDAVQLPVSDSGLKDLSQDRLIDYIISNFADKTIPKNDEQWYKRLCMLGFMKKTGNDEPQCTIAGLVLFGYTPRRLLRNAGIRWMAFEGEKKSYKALDDRLIDGPLVPLRISSPDGSKTIIDDGLIQKLLDSMQPFVTEQSNDLEDSLRRKLNWHYPREALRESIINALAHRDWTRNREIEIVRYSDRLTVLSPGSMQNSMSVEKMIAGQRLARNQLIVDVLHNYGYVEARGMGVSNKIIPLLREQNGTEPQFNATDDHLETVMYRESQQSVL